MALLSIGLSYIEQIGSGNVLWGTARQNLENRPVVYHKDLYLDHYYFWYTSTISLRVFSVQHRVCMLTIPLWLLLQNQQLTFTKTFIVT